jgi:trehalose/maltose hydrolase-like predicted phosphorylase
VVAGSQVLNASVSNSTISAFESRMDYQNGLRTWKYTWSPPGADFSVDVEEEALVSRNRPNVAAIELRLTARRIDRTGWSWLGLNGHRFRSRPNTYSIQLRDILDGRSAVRSFLGEKGSNSSTSIYVANHPDGKPDVTAWTVSTANVSNGYTDESSRSVVYPEDPSGMSIAQQWDVRLVVGKPASFYKFLGVASSDHFPQPQRQAIKESERAARDGYNKVKTEHSSKWNILMDRTRLTDYRDPFTGELPDDPAIRMLDASQVVSAFSILQNLVLPDSGLGDEGLAVSGLTSDSYGGLRFWDQDIYMYLGIVLTHPDYARQMIEFRRKQYPQALQNAQAPYVQEKYAFDNQSALFPWTSGRWGNTTATGPSLDYEYHLNGNIAIVAFIDAAITGDDQYFAEKSWPRVNSIAHMTSGLLQKEGDGWSIRNMTDPDEYAVSQVHCAL